MNRAFQEWTEVVHERGSSDLPYVAGERGRSGQPGHERDKGSANHAGVIDPAGRRMQHPALLECDYLSQLDIEASLGDILTDLICDREYQLLGKRGQMDLENRPKMEFKRLINRAYWGPVD